MNAHLEDLRNLRRIICILFIISVNTCLKKFGQIRSVSLGYARFNQVWIVR